MSIQLNVRIPDLTQSQLKVLGEKTGMTQTQLVLVAIDRFYRDIQMEAINWKNQKEVSSMSLPGPHALTQSQEM
jgi:hypothetical protein